MKSDVKYGIVIICIRFFDVTAPIIMNHILILRIPIQGRTVEWKT